MKYLVGPMDATVTCPLLPLTIKWILWLQTSVRQDSIMAKGPQIVILPSLNGQDQQTRTPVMYQSQEVQTLPYTLLEASPEVEIHRCHQHHRGHVNAKGTCAGYGCSRSSINISAICPFASPKKKKKRNSREFSSYWISRKESGKFWEVLCVQILWSCLSRKSFLAKQASAPGGMCMGDHEMSDCPTFFC